MSKGGRVGRGWWELRGGGGGESMATSSSAVSWHTSLLYDILKADVITASITPDSRSLFLFHSSTRSLSSLKFLAAQPSILRKLTLSLSVSLLYAMPTK